ncbi:unnamed protein product [Schistosoma spindalis]|nr:unnamed protein product [Schistosoma spindale]
MNFNGDLFNHSYCNNHIHSTRYKWYNFIYKNLYEQFHNVANIYFLLIIITYFFVDNIGTASVTIIPLIVILCITMIKDGLDDLLRYYSDQQLNSIEYYVLTIDFDQKSIKWLPKKSSLLSVGDVIYCKNNQSFPCDLLLLYSSNSNGQVNITTINLDGENSIKKYYTLIEYQLIYSNYCNIDQSIQTNLNSFNFQYIIQQLYLYVICQQPNENLMSFQGHYKTAPHLNHHESGDGDNGDNGDGGRYLPLNWKNLVLRGSKLISTDYIIGLVIYTGQDTKLSLNSKHSQRKYSTREKLSNMILLIFMVAMVTITILVSIISTLWIRNHLNQIWYITFELLTKWQFIRTIFRYLFIINYLIPISIIVTTEFQQLIIAYFITNDIGMYNSIENIKSTANNSQLSDELGQIEFLFCDKTGTLTQNFMILHSCCLLEQEQLYQLNHNNKHDNHDDDVDDDAAATDDDDDDNDTTTEFTTYNRLNSKLLDMNENFQEFLTIISLCHTVELKNNHNNIQLNETTQMDYSSNNSNIQESSFNTYEPLRFYEYEATSPDEKALVEGASKFGVVFSGKEPDLNETGSYRLYIDYWSYSTKSIKEPNNEKFIKRQCYLIDAVLEFDSIRKCMSIMVRYPDGTYYVLSKGAETVMLDPERCSTTSGYLRSRAIHYVNQYAIHGLRTLVFAKRILHKSMYMKLLENFKYASSLCDHERLNALKQCYHDIEYDMIPIYVTGIKDKLQPGVKNCIKALKEAGIQIWILTGDKAETAITVSQSIGHFTSNMSLIRIMNCQSLQSTAYKIYEQLDALYTYNDYHKQKPIHQHHHHHHHSILTIPRIKTINYNGTSTSSLCMDGSCNNNNI